MRWLRRLFVVAKYVCPVVGAGIAASVAIKCPESVSPRILRAIVQTIRDNVPLMVLGVSVVSAVSIASLDVWSKYASKKKTVRAILRSLHDDYFTSVKEIDKHKHRVTLFRLGRQNWWIEWPKRLVIWARIGRPTRSKTHFKVSEKQHECEGYAGQIWFQQCTMTKEIACDWSDDSTDQENYASNGYLSVEKAQLLNVKSRAFSGTIVRLGDDNDWVLLLDSEDPKPMSGNKETRIDRYAALLREVLS